MLRRRNPLAPDDGVFRNNTTSDIDLCLNHCKMRRDSPTK
jgi:hypothetical protein